MSTEDQLLITQITYAAFVIPIILCGVLLWFLIFYQKKKYESKLREQDLLLQKQQALEDERNRIAAEMHDDLGGGLTTIKFVSQRARRKMENPRDQALLDKIINQSNTLVVNMSEIIWAMNSKFDNLESTVAYIRRYSKEYLDDFDIELTFNSHSEDPQITLTSAVRRNVLLIIKEALNNIVKHAQATSVTITLNQEESRLNIEITDNGIGLVSENKLGNGLENMQDRVDQLGGCIRYENAEPGLRVECHIPV